MSKRFGKARVPGCECAYNFTCRYCLRGVPGPAADPLNDPHRVVGVDPAKPGADRSVTWTLPEDAS